MSTTTRGRGTSVGGRTRRIGRALTAVGCAAALGLSAACATAEEDAPAPAGEPTAPAPSAEAATPTEGADQEGSGEPTTDPDADAAPGGDSGDAGAEGGTQAIELQAGSVAGIELPADPEEVRAALTAAWGEPDVDEERPGCPGGGPETRLHELAWGDLSVTGQWNPERGEGPQLGSWTVEGQDLPQALDVPYDVMPGTPWDVAAGAVAAADVGADSVTGEPTIESGESEGLMWLSHPDEAEVVRVTFNRITCV